MFSRSIFPPRESDESHSHSDMVRGLVPSMSDMSAECWSSIFSCLILSFLA